MGFKVRGHICVRRKAKDGEAGAAGRSIRTTVWQAGKQYYAGDTPVDGVYPLDIVSDKAMAIGTSGVNFYMCVRSHTSPNTSNLTNTTYWQKLNSLKPVVTYLILAEAIKANFIDVADLAAASAFIQNLIANNAFITNLASDSAFINNLYVKHLNGADGDFSGVVKAQSGEITGIMKIGENGKLVTDAQLGSTHNGVSLDNDKIEFSSLDTVHGRTEYNTVVSKSSIWTQYVRSYTGVNINKTLSINYDGITIEDDTDATIQYAVFSKTSRYYLSVVSQLPTNPSSDTIYIVTGTQKGVYVGGNQIA